ncbi:MAG: hypothetical protein JRM80_09740 [Nitrososphaerota archaeon]|nr:hypothetical protein [Nitrososphaerota archaeon]
MEIQKLAAIYEPIRNAFVVVYSIVALSTILPEGHLVPGILVVPYYLLVPGYCAAVLMKNVDSMLGRLFFSVSWSLAIIAAFAALNGLRIFQLPLNAAVPIVTVLLLALGHLRSQRHQQS